MCNWTPCGPTSVTRAKKGARRRRSPPHASKKPPVPWVRTQRPAPFLPKSGTSVKPTFGVGPALPSLQVYLFSWALVRLWRMNYCWRTCTLKLLKLKQMMASRGICTTFFIMFVFLFSSHLPYFYTLHDTLLIIVIGQPSISCCVFTCPITCTA